MKFFQYITNLHETYLITFVGYISFVICKKYFNVIDDVDCWTQFFSFGEVIIIF